MPIDASIISQARNIPQIRYQPESQFESFAKIQPTLNAMRQMRQEEMQSQQSMAEQQALQEIRQRGYDPEEIGTLLQMHGKTQAQMELGVKMVQAARAGRADQRPSVVRPGEALVSPAGQELYRARADQNPKLEKVQLGDRVAFIDMNPSSPTFRQEVVSQAMGAAPEAPGAAEARGINRQRAELEAQRLDLERQRVQAQASRDAQATARLDRQIAQNEERLRLERRRVELAEGRPTALEERTQLEARQKASSLETTIKELQDISKPGGLIDQSTGSGLGAATDVAAGMFGVATPGAIAIGKLQPIADLVLKSIPRFEGPQSDKDTQSYKEAAGRLADPTVPTKIRKEAAQTIIRLMEKSRAQAQATAARPPVRAATPQSSAIPAGVDPEDWKYMTDEEKALWK
jgi:hypothetical protein